MPRPVDPHAIPPVRALLDRLTQSRGRLCLTGQHCQLYHLSEPMETLRRITGRYPTIYGAEWGFSDDRHPIDDIAHRPQLMRELRRFHREGAILVMTYHQAPPTLGEPCDFNPGVIGRLTPTEWDELLTPGSDLHARWKALCSSLADAFLELQDEGIPLVFRPYHEMNGGWFWWGGDPSRFLALWRMTYRVFTEEWGVHNLLWAWNPDKPHPGVERYFPGLDEVDLLGADIYPVGEGIPTFRPEFYQAMRALAGDKVLALSEISEFPAPEVLAEQPWDYVMGWDSLTFKANPEARLAELFADPRYR